MNLTNISDAREALRLTDDDNVTDAEIDRLILRASAIVNGYCNNELYDEWQAASPVEIPADVETATLLVLCELFLNRESSGVNTLPDGLKDILAPYHDSVMA